MKKYSSQLQIEVKSIEKWEGETIFSFDFAPEKSSKFGQVGKEVGDIGPLVQTTEKTFSAKVSLGDRKKANTDVFRRSGAALVRWLQKNNATEAGVDVSEIPSMGGGDALGALIEGIQLGSYRFDCYKTADDKKPLLTTITLLTKSDVNTLKELVSKKTILTDAVRLARNWAHEPANVINPVTLAEWVEQLANQYSLKCTVIDDKQLEKMGAGAILAVGKGSKTPSRLIVLEYAGLPEKKGSAPIALVGKALTFDSGGYSIKGSDHIVGMKYDKCGALAVVATLVAASEMKLKTPLVGIIGAAENMVSQEAYRPDDILTSLSGKTIEIVSTDAEGRLVLADALAYAQREFKPAAMIDLATLTGGVIVALGYVRAGILANDENLAKQLIASGEKTHERLWQLPLDEEYFDIIKGVDADMLNCSSGRTASTITGGIFLQQFVDAKTPWAHLDIAGVANSEKELPYSPVGATGFGIRLLIDYLESLE
jgi:leucyl aminopeptidase